MTTNNFFYTTEDIQRMKELIRTGQPLRQIAQREHANFGTSMGAFYGKLLSVSKTTRKIRRWEGPKRVRRTKEQMEQAAEQVSGFTVPAGTTFEGTPKKVMIFTDHFRIYF